MTTIPSDVYQGAGGLSEEEKTDLVPATAGEVAKYFNAVPALNKRLRGHDVSRRSTPGDPTNEDTRVLMAFVKALYNALFNGEWADPNTLELAPNGKIRVKDVYVDGDRYPGVNNGNAFYLVDNIPAIIGSMIKDGGGLATDENGELYVDFSLLDPAVLQAIVYAMVQQGGGLSVDQNGQLYVDFDSMPTDKFEALLASLKMQAPLTANKTLYVDNVLGSDTISVDGVTRPVSITDNHGTSTTPFASIGACVEYATSKYAVGRYTLTIRVITNAGVPYREYVELPMFSRTSGKMVLMADDVSSPPKLTNRPASGSVQTTQTRLLRCTGGAWELRYFDIDAAYSDAGDSNLHLPGALGVSDGGSLTVFGCSIAAEFLGAAPSATHSLRLISVSGGGTLSFDVVAQLHNSLSCITGNATDSQFIRVDNAMVRLLSRNTSSIPETSAGEYTITCTGGGQDNVFLFAQNYGQLTIVGGGNKYQNFSGPNVVGKCYTLTTGSGVYAPAGGFPGDSDPAGTVQDSTYCWYREQGA